MSERSPWSLRLALAAMIAIALLLAFADATRATCAHNSCHPTPTPAPTVRPSSTPAATPSSTPSSSPSGFVGRSGTGLVLNGVPYRFDGLNVYQAVANPCWKYEQAFATSLADIGAGQEAARVFAFQRTAITSGVRDWSYMDAMLSSAAAHGVRVILALTDQWSGQPCTDSSSARTLGWYQGGYRTAIEGVSTYRDWVGQIVARYAANPTILAWQLVNEGEARNADGSCSESTASQALAAFGTDVGGLVKSLDPNHLVGLGTVSGECGSNQGDYGLVNAPAALDLCDYHDYGYPYSAMGNTDAYNGLQVSIDRCHADGKPIFVGEAGIHWTALTTPTLAYRASLFDAKWSAQFTAGSVGELLWTWSLTASATYDYEIGPGDPSVALTGRY